MKKIVILMVCVTSFLSCEYQKPEQDLITRQLESKLAMEEKINRIATQLRADCDSNLLQMAKIKADSILKQEKLKESIKH